ncbi:MAG: L-2-amino-thiazoline-4-carboxylic acid hydrolase [Myxococcota bacterium]|nr:L-2-amino-thiazoline-4-carboxylic acid hydrolase [Myxococcota bacterium]
MSPAPKPDLTAFQRLELQMEAVVPVIRSLQRVLGEQPVLDALDEAIRQDIAEAERGPKGEGRPEAVAQGFAFFGAGDALEYETLELGPERAAVDVTRCAYHQLMQRLDALDLGPSLICKHDFAMAIRLGLRLDRTQTCMEGASHCDFRYVALPAGARSPRES